ncbi:hypothetical protein KY290_034455 [Solanum tuberosum]|uniref:Uncharacterized protein n=1 Tax=Solanum tuberosum TaxID=4113 RepID=A0ABQ7U393_SOLTU|nr:hypothetical protein KY290_034455 [Solanum tuberosum]
MINSSTFKFLDKSSIFSKKAHVRALSTSVLRDSMYAGSVKPSVKEVEDVNGIHNPAYQYLSISIIDWKTDIGKSLMCEANNRLENGMSAQSLDTSARLYYISLKTHFSGAYIRSRCTIPIL